MNLDFLWEWLGRTWPGEALFGPPGLALFRRTFVALLLLGPMLGLLGVQVVNARYAFFSDAVSHAALAGIGLGAFANAALDRAGSPMAGWVDPRWTLPAFAVFFGLAVTFLRRRGRMAVDTATGVCFALVTAAGLCLVHRFHRDGGDVEALMFGQSAVAVRDGDVAAVAALLAAVVLFMAWGGNRLVLAGLDGRLAEAHGVRAAAYEYAFCALLALVVAVTARMAGVLMVTALLVAPAAAGRYFAGSWRAQCWWSMAVASASVAAGYLLSLHPAVDLPSGALAVLCAGAAFAASLVPAAVRHARTAGR